MSLDFSCCFYRLNFVPAAAVIPWGLLNVFGLCSFMIMIMIVYVLYKFL
jgi:hypothetical protein